MNATPKYSNIKSVPIGILALLLAVSGAALAVQVPAGKGATQVIEDPSGHALRVFYRELERARRGKGTARVLHYGDSHVAADLLTGVLRRELQDRFGDGGPGFILPGRPWAGYIRPGITSQASSGWQTDGLTESALATDGRFGLAGVSVSANTPGSWVRVTAAARHFEVGLMRQPRGASVEIWLDDDKSRSVSLNSSNFETVYVPVDAKSRAGTEGTHTLEVRVTSTGPARVFGVVVEKGGGVVYDALGINGARASRPARWDWKILSNSLERRNPDLIVLAYGTNEADDADLDLADYRARFTALLRQFHRAAPRASLLVIGPPDRAREVSRRWRSIERLPALVEAQRRAAFDAGAAFYDQYAAMGGSGSMDRWALLADPLAQPDRVHLTQQGYSTVAGWLFSRIQTGYSNLRRLK